MRADPLRGSEALELAFGITDAIERTIAYWPGTPERAEADRHRQQLVEWLTAGTDRALDAAALAAMRAWVENAQTQRSRKFERVG